MSGFIKGENRYQRTLFPESLDEYVSEDNPARVVDVFIDSLDLEELGFSTKAKGIGRPGYHPSIMLKLYVYGYLNRVQSSRRLEREAQRNIELMWLTSKLTPDFKTIADFRKDNGNAIEHPFGTIKCWMGHTHFQTIGIDKVASEMSLHILAYNIKRCMSLLGTKGLLDAIKAIVCFLTVSVSTSRALVIASMQGFMLGRKPVVL